MTETILILIADDHAIVRKGLHTLISSEPGMDLVGEATDGVEAVLKARSLHPDVILLDLVMPRQDGVEAIIEIKKEDPKARILVLTSFAEEEKVFAAIKAGALGYLLKDSSPEELLQAIRAVAQRPGKGHRDLLRAPGGHVEGNAGGCALHLPKDVLDSQLGGQVREVARPHVGDRGGGVDRLSCAVLCFVGGKGDACRAGPRQGCFRPQGSIRRPHTRHPHTGPRRARHERHQCYRHRALGP